MNDPSSNPLYVVFLFLLRCLVPVAILFGISYLLRKMGFVAAETPEPPDDREDDEINNINVPAPESRMNVDSKGKAGKIVSPGKTRPKTSGKSGGRKKPVAKPRSHSK